MNETANGPIRAVMDELERHAREQMLRIAEGGGATARRAMSGALSANETLVKVYSRRVRELESQLAEVMTLATMVPNPPPGHRWSSAVRGGVSGAPAGTLLCAVCTGRSHGGEAPGAGVVTATECLAAFMAKGAVGGGAR